MHASVWGRDLRERLDRDAAALPVPSSADVVTEDEVARLPLPVQPPRSLVLVSADAASGVPVPTPVGDGLGATWQWLLRPVGDGTRTRLLSRQRTTHPRGQRVLWRIVEPIGFVMERRMLLGIKERAERTYAATRTDAVGGMPRRTAGLQAA